MIRMEKASIFIEPDVTLYVHFNANETHTKQWTIHVKEKLYVFVYN